jgi:4-amino-4-deoxy-L-arabinose transferase-like glycosyltransferase
MNNHSSRQPLGQIRKIYFVLFFIATFIFLYLRTFLLPGIPLVAAGDETLYFTHGIRILHGQVPFRDYFTYVMPGVDLFYAGAFGLFGIHAWLAQAFEILLGTSIAVVLVWISRSVLSGSTIFLPSLLFLVLDFDVTKDATHHWYSTLFVLIATGVLLGGRSVRRVLAVGALCGLATLFTQSQGVVSLIVIAAYLWWTREEDKRIFTKQLLALVLPFAVIVGGFIGYFVYRAGFSSVYYALVTFVFLYFPALKVHSPQVYLVQIPPHHTMGDLSRFIPYLLIHLFLPFGYLFCLFRLFRDKKMMDRRTWESVLLVNLIGLALFAAVANAPSYYRMCMVAPPATIVCVWLVSGTSKSQRRMRGLFWVVAIVAMLVLPFQLQRHWRGYVDLPIGRAGFLDPALYEEFRWFAQRTHPGESFFDGPQITFALSLDNPTTVDYVTPTEYTTPEQVSAAIEGMEKNKTPVIALYEHNYAPKPDLYARGRTRSNLGPFLDYVYRNYHMVKVFPSLQIWERN